MATLSTASVSPNRANHGIRSIFRRLRKRFRIAGYDVSRVVSFGGLPPAFPGLVLVGAEDSSAVLLGGLEGVRELRGPFVAGGVADVEQDSVGPGITHRNDVADTLVRDTRPL